MIDTDTKEFFLDRDGLKIHCKLSMPAEAQNSAVESADAPKYPLMILQHGVTGHMEEPHLLGVTERMLAIGVAVLRVELYGHGASDGRFEDHTIWKWVDQMQAVVTYAAGLPSVTKLILAGHSQGGLTAMLVGAMERDRLDALIPLSPATVLWDAGRKGELLGHFFDPQNLPESIELKPGLAVGQDYLRSVQLLPVEDAISHFTKPVLIVHGDEDDTVPVQYGIEAAARYQNAALALIKGDTHCYDNHLEQALDAIEDFVRKLLMA